MPRCVLIACMYVCMYVCVCVWSQGRCYVYSMHGITYRVVADDDGLFNGSDEFACKADNLPYHTIPYPTLPCVTTLSSPEQAAGNERRAALEFMQLGGLGLGLLPKMHVPLTCTVDVMGARVLCVAKQPVQAVRPHPPPYSLSPSLSHSPVVRAIGHVHRGGRGAQGVGGPGARHPGKGRPLH